MIRKSFVFCVTMVALSIMVSATAQAEAIVSNTFSLNYGFSGNEAWDDSESASVNVNVIGDFTLSLTFENLPAFSYHGPTFVNGVLADGQGGDRSARSCAVDITATYTGDVGMESTIKLVIDQISIYGLNYHTLTNTPDGTDEIFWTETTVDNAGTSGAIDLGTPQTSDSTDLADASLYGQLIWDAGAVEVDGTEITRSFVLTTNGGAFTAPALDGFSIVGHVETTASEVPEPGTIALLITGLFGLLIWRRR